MFLIADYYMHVAFRWCGPCSPQCLCAGATSAASDATTVRYPDADAIANAKKGYQEVQLHDAMVEKEQTRGPATPACATTRPPLVRVNSVPIFTPQDKIRRSYTPTPALTNAVEAAPVEATPVQATPVQTTPVQATPVQATENGGECTTPKTTKTDNIDSRPKTTKQDIEKAEEPMPSKTPVLAAPVQSGEEKPEQKANAETKCPSAKGEEHDTASSTLNPGKKAAKKAAPKPVKTETVVTRQDTKEIKAAQVANLQRANTLAQKTPQSEAAPTPSQPEVGQQHAALPKNAEAAPELPPPSPSSGASSPGPPPQDTETDLETLLDRQVKQEPCKREHEQESVQPPRNNGAPHTEATVATEDQPASKRGRREKTPAEKAAHARYMRFSRSFQRILVYAAWYISPS